ncbi:MAG: SEC-C metal-binding domain-containing protein [Verrucomicrobiae bacterium]|nr:SEC-C metal-binding domain-containing protein [Verrucomicrobiae bacterium]
MSILHYDESTQGHTLRLAQGTFAGQSFAVSFKFCPSPMCPCPHVTLLCRPLGADGKPSDANGSRFEFTLNVSEHTIVKEAELEGQPRGCQLARDVAAGLSEEDWDELFRLLVKEKQRQSCEMDLDTVDVRFPPDVAGGSNGTVVGFAELFPFSGGFPFQIGRDKWLAHDHYCVDYNCSCRDTLVSFIPIPDSLSAGKEVRADDVPSAFFNYRSGVFKTQQLPSSGQPSLKILFDGLQSAHPDFKSGAQQRHVLMKRLYKRSQQLDHQAKIREASRDSLPQPGRNDPCPCGSGKKHKKCCGRAA